MIPTRSAIWNDQFISGLGKFCPRGNICILPKGYLTKEFQVGECIPKESISIIDHKILYTNKHNYSRIYPICVAHNYFEFIVDLVDDQDSRDKFEGYLNAYGWEIKQ